MTETQTARDAVTSFMDGWIDRDWKAVEASCQKTWLSKHKNPKRVLANDSYLTNFALTGFDIEAEMTPEGSDNLTMFRVALNEQPHHLVTVRETGPYKPSEDGAWGVNPRSIKPLGIAL